MAQTFLVKNGDVVLDRANGRPAMISGLDKTVQDFNELLSIETQSNGFGANIITLVGFVPESPLDVSFKIMERINVAVTRWIALQKKQRAVRTDDEIVTRLIANQALVDQSDQSRVTFRAGVLVRSQEEIIRSGRLQAG